MPNTVQILHIITGLGTGGAEMVLYNLLSQMDKSAFQPEVCSLTPVGAVGGKIAASGIPVWSLGMQRGVTNLFYLLKLAQYLKTRKPAIVHTWMYKANLIGGLAAKMVGKIPVVWAIHHSNLHPKYNKRSTLLTVRMGAWSNRWLAHRIVVVSQVSKRIHASIGYSASKMVFIPNGFSIERFKPDKHARTLVRQELAIAPDTLLIGLVARFDPQKDHANFIQAAGVLHKIVPDVHFLLCGNEIIWDNHHLVQWIETAGIREQCHLLGERDDIPRLLASLDIGGISSSGEAFPMVVGETMACGVPCVVTDVGDSSLIVGETGRVVSPRDPESLAMAWKTLIDLGTEGREYLGMQARQRISEHYSLPMITKQYERLYQDVVSSY
jgi:glycosyltransferase involved in cell wall biosynthesis